MSEPISVYAGWLVDPDQREPLLARFPPRYATVVAHHVTQKFGDETVPPPAETVGEIVGEADDGQGVQALVVAIGGSPVRPDGGTYHITWSLADSRAARESNEVIAQGWTRFAAPTPVRLVPQL